MAHSIGIDFGTAHCRVAVFHEGKLCEIENKEGKRCTPSTIAFVGEHVLVGSAAANHISASNIVWGIKRIIGLDDREAGENKSYITFPVVADSLNRRGILMAAGQRTMIYPEEVIAVLLTEMKRLAESFLGEKVTDAVISVPACFNAKHRRIVTNAALIAGLNVLRLLNEPTAAALAYAADRCDPKKKRKLLVVDCGAGTTDISFLSLHANQLVVDTSVGSRVFGGIEINETLVRYVTTMLEKQYGIPEQQSALELRQIRAACEHLKKTLSSSCQATTDIEASGQVITITMTRAEFESICEPHFQHLRQLLEKACHACPWKKSIDEILLVGGSSRIPKIQSVVFNYFGGKPISGRVKAEEAVVMGAALYAAMLICKRLPVGSIHLTDVLSYHILTMDKKVLVDARTQVPRKPMQLNIQAQHVGLPLEWHLLDGYDYNSICTAKFENVQPNIKGMAVVNVMFEIDVSGILQLKLPSGAPVKPRPSCDVKITSASISCSSLAHELGVLRDGYIPEWILDYATHSNSKVIVVYPRRQTALEFKIVEGRIEHGRLILTPTNNALTLHLSCPLTESLFVHLTMSRNFQSLTLTARCIDQSSIPDVTMSVCDGSLKKGEVDQISSLSIRRTDGEAAQSQIDAATNDLENRCFSLKRSLRSGKETIDNKTAEVLVRECDNVLSWLEDQRELSLECIISRHEALNRLHDGLLRKCTTNTDVANVTSSVKEESPHSASNSEPEAPTSTPTEAPEQGYGKWLYSVGQSYGLLVVAMCGVIMVLFVQTLV